VEIINENKKTEKKEDSKNNTFFKDTYNNIIAFTGERGTGKSSSMISFALAIKDLKSNGKETVFDKEANDLIRECHFEEIGVIDPSMFEEKDNILEIIIAKMFSRFNRRIEDTSSDIDRNEKRELLKAFQKVYENLKTIQKEKNERLDGEIIETLSSLASGSNLKDSIVELVESYLKFMGRKNNNCYFLLVIDDFDLNIQHAGEMAEQIRKYLVIPRVVILLAAKIDQLLSIIEQNYRKKFETMLRSDVERMASCEPQNMASLYLEKLIPEDRRLYLTEIRKIENKNIHLKIEVEEEKFPEGQLEDTILKLIYDKTGLIFLKHDYDFHFLIPDNLRDLNSLYVMLHALKNVNEVSEDERKKALEESISRFEDYFFNTWIKNKLSFGDQRITEDFMFVDIRQKNKFIINAICKRNEIDKLKRDIELKEKKCEEFMQIIDKGNSPSNVSLGDVLFFLKTVLLLDDNFKTNKLIFSIKTIYSLMFYKLLYIDRDYKNVQLLLGGSIYNPEDIELIRREKGTQNRRDHFTINYENAAGYLDLEEKWEFLEWLHYFILFVGDRKHSYRREEDKYYDKKPNLAMGRIAVKTAIFDVIAFVFFTFNSERLLERNFSGDKMYSDWLKNYNNSLYNKILTWRKTYHTHTPLPIYSIELLEKILQLVSDSKNIKEKAKEGYYSYLKHFFQSIKDAIEKIKEKNAFLDTSDILTAYRTHPIISEILEPGYLKLESHLNDLLRSPTSKDLDVFLNDEIKSFENTPQTDTGAKRKLTRFRKNSANYSELKTLYEKIKSIRRTMDSKKEFEAIIKLYNDAKDLIIKERGKRCEPTK
jgi:anion-transporting  ArsA/GET3 family ATPase